MNVITTEKHGYHGFNIASDPLHFKAPSHDYKRLF